MIKNSSKSFNTLVKLVDKLREECPWDKEQTFESLRPLTIEETYELAEAVIKKDVEGIKEELGDLLMHIVFYAKIASEKDYFDLNSILDVICSKLIRRHPHVFKNYILKDVEAIKRNWEKIKLAEKKSLIYSLLDSIPRTLPTLIKSQKIQEKASAVGFDWKKKEDVWKKIEEKLRELKFEFENGKKESQEKEFGDVFFSLINLARLYNINAENALEKTNIEFSRRFNYIEKKAREKKTTINKLCFSVMEKYWQESKNLLEK